VPLNNECGEIDGIEGRRAALSNVVAEGGAD
jgi:hypothetical protein